MQPKLRRATLADIDAICAVKRSLMIAPGTPALHGGGFLLGSSPDRYAFYIEQAHVSLLEADGRLLGFAITLPDPLLRQSELWSRAERIDWQSDPSDRPGLDLAAILSSRIGYFEQLALLRIDNLRIYAPAFALAAALELADSGHRHIFLTVVSAPWPNLAPLPFLRILGAQRVGRIAEEYPEVGAITSDIYQLDTQTWTYGVGPGDPLHALRERIRKTVTALQSSPSAPEAPRDDAHSTAS